MNFAWFISRRYLQAKRRKGFISLISLISVAGVMVGVAALIVVLAVMTGFTAEFRDKILGINSHIIVQQPGYEIDNYHEPARRIAAIPGVAGVTPYIYGQAMITGGVGGTGAIVRGIDPETVNRVLQLEDYLEAGELAGLAAPANRRAAPGVILGKDLARNLGVGLDDRVKLISAAGPLTPMGVIPQITTFRVAGLFASGMYEYDSSLAYLSLDTAREFMDLGDRVHGLEVRVDDINRADRIARAINDELGPSYHARDWMNMNRQIFSALALEKAALSVIMTLVVMVAAFNIVSTLIMVVMEKTRDIAILKAMGATDRSIMRIFMYEGLVIGTVGTGLGVTVGLGLCEILSRYRFIDLPDVYPISTLPVQVLPQDVILISLAAVLITFLATIYPSWRAAKVDPAVALRYE
ncbi:lipoprotein-releasing ABC transporter permease subunit [Desulfurivibrio alkaliphilus]|uniref:Lipoprotein releasing system, transmembrane protein, LolC/E family n=1 Tax=Desulfurivibrio alkaliphilus (strain DSM 19089 / UNIQEM U267 / AHT2) TaxID=589865 RepID=D6Z377_DESAT|nr:lipoprotein-releasing ABC transporter permease subunit [Desulfurivibrio alkaliphilus]ADH86002.1 lipoprotein releasing system, transmembrane protein, LolC/E family [Desulfurivibrio alkaliphilus AHT 2]